MLFCRRGAASARRRGHVPPARLPHARSSTSSSMPSCLDETTDAYAAGAARLYSGSRIAEFAPYAIGAPVSRSSGLISPRPSRDENYLLPGRAVLCAARHHRRPSRSDARARAPTSRSRPITVCLGQDVTFFSTRVWRSEAYQRLGDNDRLCARGLCARSARSSARVSRPAGGQAALCRRRGFGQGLCLSACRPARFIRACRSAARSSLEFGAELRTASRQPSGIVPFVDAGNVFPALLPDR